ncbi:hypothetical protein ACFL0T_04955 [Candidatus Omnitrophota bacterium]
MSEIKTKSIRDLEAKLQETDDNPMRHRVLESAKSFKTSWIELGQTLYSVWKDKLYKEWGYNKFDTYVSKEIGIRKQTALKLLRSYFFLEKEEPRYLRRDFNDEAQPAKVPSYESVNVLRLAKNKKDIDKQDYAQIRRKVLDEARDHQAVRKDLTSMIRERDELLPEEAWQKKKIALIKRLLTTLRTIRSEIKAAKILPVKIVTDTDKLIDQLEAEVE